MNKRQPIIKEVIKDLYERLALFDNDSFVHKITSLSEHLDISYQSLLNQYDSRIFFGDDIKSVGLNEFEYNTFNIMKIMALVTEELKKNHNNLNKLQEIIEATTSKSNLPDWLKKRLITYIPPLLIKNYAKDFINQTSLPKNERYIVFLKGKIINMAQVELDVFLKENRPDKFDIFIESTDNVNIYIKNRSKIFRAGNYHTFNILSLFLQRQGKDLTYQEIYHLAIKPTETTAPRDHSKKVYDYLKIIKKKISECQEIDIDPEEWFKRDHKKGIIHISQAINSCLITTEQHILI